MYLEHFGLAVNPFGLSPKLDFLYKSETFEESMAHLIYGLENQEAIVLITGAIGTGKTMALQSFLMNLGPRFEFALITNTRLTANELLKMTLEDLGEKFPVGCDKSDLLILFKEFLLKASEAGKRVLIVVDEAQNLSSEVLEEIRLLTNLGQGESQPVQIILVGQPELETTVNRPDLAQLRQRIRVHYHLDPLSRKEIEEYIHHRMSIAGCPRKVFSPAAIDMIYQESRGIPRLVNTMAGEALLSAFVAGHDKVQAGDVECEKDLSFAKGPVPTVAPPPAQTSPSGPAVAPPVSPTPDVSTGGTQVIIPPRKSTNGVWRMVRGWAVAALVVIVLGSLYFMGVLDGVLTSINPVVAEESRTTPRQPDVQVEKSVAEIKPDQKMEEPNAPTVRADSLSSESTDSISKESREPAKIENAAVNEIQVEQPSGKSTSIASVGNTYIHISSFRAPERAQSLKMRMKNVGPGVVSLTRESKGSIWYRVYLGPYPSREAAYSDAVRLEQDGIIEYYRLTTIEPDQLN